MISIDNNNFETRSVELHSKKFFTHGELVKFVNSTIPYASYVQSINYIADVDGVDRWVLFYWL